MKPLARLTSDLLFRKGSAQPAVPAPHRHGILPGDEAPAQPAPNKPAATAQSEPRLAKKPLAWPGAARPDQTSSGQRAQAGGGGKRKRVRVSLRLDLTRHQRLKLAAMQGERTQQSLLTQALDEYLERHAPEVLKAIPPVYQGGGRATNDDASND
ncbi:MAG: hypothetical protein V3T80_07000 [Kiloniellales bacterium]|jgi:hypothetical protein